VQPRFFLDRMSGTLDRVTASVTRAEQRESPPRLAADSRSVGRNATVAVPATAKRREVSSLKVNRGRQSRGPALFSGRRHGGPTPKES
jgi:hypothetical protein